MAVADSDALRALLSRVYPRIHIERNLRPSGQRLVYFCHFQAPDGEPAANDWSGWGNVVLKVSADMHPTVVARLEKEREILNGLKSEYFARQRHFDVITTDPQDGEKIEHPLFITIEDRIEGRPLSECMGEFSTEANALMVLKQLVAGLTLLWEHPQRIIHRDLKPDNIIVRPDNSPAIIDLGIVREQGSDGVTLTLQHFGPCTPAYASPEQLRNQKRSIDYRADFFSLGVIIYQLLTGENPFAQSNKDPLSDVVHRVLTLVPPTLAQRGQASAQVSALIEWLMAKEPYKRPRTVRILSDEINRISEAR